MPPLQTQLRHSRHRHSYRAPELRESVEQGHAHMRLHHLTLKRARHHPLAQAFEAVHLGLHQAPSVIAAPLLVGQLHLQCLLAPAHGAEVGHLPIQMGQAQQALAQGQTKQALDAQAELDGRVAEHLLPAPFAAGWRVPLHVFVQPDRQRASGFEGCVVCRPVGSLVVGFYPLGFTHGLRPRVRGRGCATKPRQ